MVKTLQIADLALGLRALGQGVVSTTYLTATTTTPGSGQFYSSIVGRERIVDPTANLNCYIGYSRHQVFQLSLLAGEQGPNNEQIYKCVNDKNNHVRFGGLWNISQIDSNGNRPLSTTQGSFVEIVFYGTGLDMLTMNDGSGTPPDLRVSVDGGAEGSNIWTTATFNTLAGRGPNPNQVMSVVHGLTLGLHTVKIRLNNSPSWSWGFYGFETLVSSSSVSIMPGTAIGKNGAIHLRTGTTTPYNSSFESGTLGTKGGKVALYLKEDGTIAKSLTPTNTSQANLSLADHTNEQVARSYFWREFGMSKSDDFATLTVSNSDRAFTINDGTTTLMANPGRSSMANGPERLEIPGSPTANLMFTFVGTGLDVECASNVNGADLCNVFVDGASVGSITMPTLGPQVRKIVSGLPYGTHTVEIFNTTPAGGTPGFSRFIVYEPKKPSIPDSAIELCTYNIMATYSAVSTAGRNTIGTGVLRKAVTKELNYYVTNLSVSAVSTGTSGSVSGFEVNNNVSGGRISYTFFGTGFEMRYTTGSNRSATIQVNLNGNNATTGNFPTLSGTILGGQGSFNTGSGVLSQNGSTVVGAALRISNLPLGKYTVDFINGAANFMVIESLDIITPIHSHRDNSPYTMQNNLASGSQALKDSRLFIEDTADLNNALSCLGGASSGPSTNEGSNFLIIPELTCPIKTNGGALEISFDLSFTVDIANAGANFAIFVDGLQVGREKNVLLPSTSVIGHVSDAVIVYVSPGYHHVDIRWSTAGVGGVIVTANTFRRSMRVKELP